MHTIIRLKCGRDTNISCSTLHSQTYMKPVYTSFQIAKKYLQYYSTAFNSKGHGMHSPFVFEFILDVLNNRQNFQLPTGIETVRKGLLQNKTLLHINDLGAGSRVSSSKIRTVAQVAKTALKSKKWSGLFYRLVKKYSPEMVVELGTSLGITTAYLSSAAPCSTIFTIEGSEPIQKLAQHNFKKLNLNNIQSLQGPFDDVLPLVLHQLSLVNLAYVDGNHRYAPTMNYFFQLLKKRDNDTIMIFDDIHWSAEMEQAWKEIKGHPAVRCTIDVFFLGFVFFKKEFRVPQHFTIRF